MTVQASIICAALLLAASILLGSRWEMSVTVGGEAYRLDRWTGDIRVCNSMAPSRLAANQLGMGAALRCDGPTADELARAGFGQ